MKNIIVILIFFQWNNSFAQNTNLSKIDDELIDLIIDFGKTYKGTKYFYGGCSSLNKGFDCSGFMFYIFKSAGFKITRTSKDLSLEGKKIQMNKLKKGDFVFFHTLQKSGVNHVGIISSVNDGKIIMLHISSSKGVQEIDIKNSSYWNPRFLFGRRF